MSGALPAPGGRPVGPALGRDFRAVRRLLAPDPAEPRLLPDEPLSPGAAEVLRRSRLLAASWPALRDAGESGAPAPLREEARAAYDDALAANLLRLAALGRAGEELRVRRVTAVLQKGTALVAAGILQPGCRDSRDLDLLVPADMRAAASEAFRRAGFEAGRVEREQESWILRPGDGPPVGVELHVHPLHGELRFGPDARAQAARSREAPGLPPSIRVPALEDLFVGIGTHSVVRQKERALALRALFDLRAIAGAPGFSWDAAEIRAEETGASPIVAIRVEDLRRWFPGLVPARAFPVRASGPRRLAGRALHAREVARAFERGSPESAETRTGRPVVEFLWAPGPAGAFRALRSGLPRESRQVPARGNARGIGGLVHRYRRVFTEVLFAREGR